MSLLVSIAILGGLAALWWTREPPAPASADPRWTATAFVLAGDGTPGSRGGERERARFSDPFGIAIGVDGTIYVADAGDAPAIRAISPGGRVSILAGGTRGFADGVGADARFDTPSGLALDAGGVLYVADTGNHAIRRVTLDGSVTTLAGDGTAGNRDGAAADARFDGPIGVAVDAAGRIHVADTGNGFARVVDRAGAVTTASIAADGPFRPIGIAVGDEGERYVSDERGRILAVLPSGDTRTLAGSTPGFRDGLGADARFRAPAGLALAGRRRLIVADAGNALVRLVADRAAIEPHLPASPLVAPRFDVDGFAWRPLLWPVDPMEGPHEIAGTLGEARGGDGAERFHAGVDVRIDEGTVVHAVRDTTVTSPLSTGDFGSLNEWLRTGPLAYVHIRAGRLRNNALVDAARFVPTYDERGTLARVRVRRGARFATGDVVGSVNRFNHVHLNVGWLGEEHNPLRLRLVHFADTVPPSIAHGGVQVFDRDGLRLDRREHGRLLVSGPVQIVVDAWDQSDGNRPNRRLGLYDLGYQLLGRDGSPAPGFDTARVTIRFDRLALEPDAARIVYAPGSGIPFYGQRRTRFLYVVTNTFRDGVAMPGMWDTSTVAPGDYILRAWVADVAGNVAVANRDVPITIVAP